MRIDRDKDGMVKAGVAKLFGSRKYIKPIAIAIALVLIIGVIANAANPGSSAAATEIKETQAKLGDVSKTISASGTLSDDASINIKIPEGVILSDILVSEGDAVKKGDILAKVNRASVAKVILQLEEEADDIEDAMNSLSGTSDTTSDAYLKKVVYDEELSDINSAISKLRDMLDTGTITASKSGTITSVNATEGESVNVTSGSSVNSSSSQGASGTSSTKTVSANTTYVSANTTNASANLTNAAASASMQSSTNLTGSAALLAAMDTAGIEATEAGTTDIVTAATTNTKTAASTGIVTASTDTAEEESDDAGYTLAASSIEDSDNATDESNEIITGDDLVTLLIAQPSAGATPQSRVASTSKYDASITWNTGAAFKAGGKYTAVVELTSKDGYRFGDASAYGISVEGGTLTEGTPKVTGGTASGNRLVLKVSFEVPEETSTGNNGDNRANGESAGSNQEKSSAGGSSAGAGSVATGSNSPKKTSGSGNASSGGTSSVSTSSSTSTSDNLIESSLEMATVFSMSSDSEVTVTVSVDEADINSVKTGQTANVTLDAVEGESFEGEITKVSNTSSTGSGGNVKYSVTITMDKTDDMKSGMTASAVINIEEANDVIVIPSAAINEKNGEAYVYTRNENDELSGKTVVTTGLSDGNMVEITSGLSEGDTVYYEVRTKESSSDNSSREKGGEMSGMPEMGGSPGEMPQGGPSGNGGGPSGS